MRTSWEPLAGRARGLGTHLLDGDKLALLERQSGVADFIGALEQTPYARFMPPRGAEVALVDLAIGRSLADRLGVLARWAGPGGGDLLPFFFEHDVQNVRAILRGVTGALPPDQRVVAAIPTPTLGRRALETLSRSESAGAVASTLAVWGHPIGSELLPEARRTRPDVFRLEAALGRWWVGVAASAARKGGPEMRRFVAETITVHNLTTALLLSTARSERPASASFVEGGDVLTLQEFERAATSGDRLECGDLLAKAARRTLYEEPLRSAPEVPARLAERLLEARIERVEREHRRDPLSAAPVILFLLRLRRESRRLRRALWSASLAGGAAP